MTLVISESYLSMGMSRMDQGQNIGQDAFIIVSDLKRKITVLYRREILINRNLNSKNSVN